MLVIVAVTVFRLARAFSASPACCSLTETVPINSLDLKKIYGEIVYKCLQTNGKLIDDSMDCIKVLVLVDLQVEAKMKDAGERVTHFSQFHRRQ